VATCAGLGRLLGVVRPTEALPVADVEAGATVAYLNDVVSEHAAFSTAAPGPLAHTAGVGDYRFTPCWIFG
jgi:hypothetical protein